LLLPSVALLLLLLLWRVTTTFLLLLWEAWVEWGVVAHSQVSAASCCFVCFTQNLLLVVTKWSPGF
jgi:hypothetical protein